ncbi:tRNA adenosine(34) deaminase TadA [Bowmanella sp. JS7-9]|uniref:tRNA-specific adenosine deaminase n=1 Tax=Pseudobowmanella zhangzhouensis TaxID=1537679 RepID=A0ABW1XKH5_9ALTE|nr:tRNA adenosine(34) deaminase TadA [Bowmanella sp. JS7-9]
MTTNTDEFWMQHALSLAQQAERQGEIPVGAVLVKNNEVIGEGFNQSIMLNDPSAHAEMQAIRAAGRKVNNYRLVDSTLYVTLEPCAMCAGALVHARVARVVYGAADAKTGAAGSVMDICRHPALNHQIDVESGVLAKQCSTALSAFFRRRRKEQKQLRQSTTTLDSTESVMPSMDK